MSVSQSLLYPWLDMTLSSYSQIRYARGYTLSLRSLMWYRQLYVSEGEVTDPIASPYLATDASLAKLPPTQIICAECDVLADEGTKFAGRLTALGVPCSYSM